MPVRAKAEVAAGAALRPRQRIGVPRFELGTSPTRTERATRLRHTPEPRDYRTLPGALRPLAGHAEARTALGEPVHVRARRQKRTTSTSSPPGRVSDSPSRPSAPIANVVQRTATTIGSPEGVLRPNAPRSPGSERMTR